MATGKTSKRCSMCKKDAKSNCTGCQKSFCVKDYTKHRQQLSVDFDSDVVRNYDELLQQIHQTTTPDDSIDDLLSQVDRWEERTIDKIHKAAEEVRHQLTHLINYERETLRKQFESLTNEVRRRREEEDFDEKNIENFQRQIHQLQQTVERLNRPNNNKLIIVENDEIDWNQFIYVHKSTPTRHLHLPLTAKWTQNGVNVAGGHSTGNELNSPWGVYVDDDQTLYVTDHFNHGIVEWKRGRTNGKVVAGGNGQGNRNDQLNHPTDVIIDRQTDSFIICDSGNKRVVRWPRRGGTNGQTIIANVKSFGLTMDDDGFLYVSDWIKHEVRRWRIGESEGTLVAGGNGCGQRLDQLFNPSFIFVDRNHSVYVSDLRNHRVMKWMKDAKEGVVVAGGQGEGNALTQLSNPQGVIADQLGTVYVADQSNQRIMRWSKKATQGSVVLGGNGQGEQTNQLNSPCGLSFDCDGNFYVVDYNNRRVQKYSIVVV